MAASVFDMVFSAMQVKSESAGSDILCNDQISTASSPENHMNTPPQEMPCVSSSDKNSPYSLWAEYFDNFPILTEFDLRSGVNNSTGSSVVSSSSASCESWSSPGSGSPFSDCEQEDSPFSDHSVPTSVIDEIVQTLKMDGYNFDHLGDEIIDMPSSQVAVKQESDMMGQSCYMQSPVYASLNPPKLQQMEPCRNKYPTTSATSGSHCMMAGSSMVSNVPMMNMYDQVESKWCSNTGHVTSNLPPMSMALPQIHPHSLVQSHPPPPQLQHAGMHSQSMGQHTQQTLQPMHPLQASYESEPANHYNTSPVFPSTYNLQNSNTIDPYKYSPEKSPIDNASVTSQQPHQHQQQQHQHQQQQQPQQQGVQTSEKSTETKPRRRRSNHSGNRIEKPHVCKECGAAFKLSANLKQHQVIHTGEKPFSCEICKAMFTRLSSLKTHHRLHTGEKPHICPFCSAAFADRSAMKAHKRIHTGERPYKCQVCNTSFTQLSHLNAHKRTHTGEKPYACAVCGTTFKQLGHLKRHEKSHICSRI